MNVDIVLPMIELEKQVEKLSLFKRLKSTFPVQWNIDADPLLRDRYFIKDNEGNVIENQEELIYRVATALTDEASQIEKFYQMMSSGMFLPNTPTLINSQRPLGMLSACLVLPTGDSIEQWGRTLYNHMIMVKAGIGTGIDLSEIRQKGAMISTTKGEAGGALGFLRLINESAQLVKQGSVRPSANMGTMRITHPELENFIKSKAAKINDKGEKVWTELEHFNISITAFDEEFEALFDGRDIPIIEPHTKKILGFRKGYEILDLIVKYVWEGGDPGLLNLTKANKNNPIVNLINPITDEAFGLKMVTNPCGEQWLYAFSVCNLGSLNLVKFTTKRGFDFDTFAIYVEWGIEFLDAVIDANRFPIAEIDIMSNHLRNIGLGIMGWADTLLELKIPYDSEEAIELAEQIMFVFRNSADKASHDLAKRNGVAPVFRDTNYDFRNYERTCIAPTGSISHIAGVSSGIEPNFTFAYTRKTSLRDGTEFFVVNNVMRKQLKYHKDYKNIINAIIQNGGILCNAIAQKYAIDIEHFRTTFDVSPEWHIRHQAVFQNYVDNAVSKTINVPEHFTQEQIKKAYKLSWELGCKGITIYRDKSRVYQILNSNKLNNNNGNNNDKSLIQQIKNEKSSSEESSSEESNGKERIKSRSKESSKEEINLFKSLNICCDYPNPIQTDGCTKCVNCGHSYCG